MTDQLLCNSLSPQITYLRGKITHLRDQLSGFDNQAIDDDYRNLVGCETKLNAITCTVSAAANTPQVLTQANTDLEQITNSLDLIDRKFVRKIGRLQQNVALWGLLILALSGISSYFLYINNVAPKSGPLDRVPSSWTAVRLVLLACSGGLAGTGIVLSRILSRVIPARALDPRQVLWDFVSPLFSAALAGAFFLVIRATPQAFMPGATTPNSSGAPAAFVFGLLIGFAPDAIIYRIKSIVKVFFGTDEVAPPQVTKPQVVRMTDTTVRVTVIITSSAAADIVTANVFLQIPGGDAAFIMTRNASNLWTADIDLPQSNDLAGPNQSNGSLIVEAWDSTGNVSRSNLVSLPPLIQKSDAAANQQITAVNGNTSASLSIAPNPAITMVTLTPLDPPDTLGNFVSGTAFQILPLNTSFVIGPPAQLTIAYDVTQIPQGKSEDKLGLFNVVANAWQLVPGAMVDTTMHTVTAPIISSGSYAVFAQP